METAATIPFALFDIRVGAFMVADSIVAGSQKGHTLSCAGLCLNAIVRPRRGTWVPSPDIEPGHGGSRFESTSGSRKLFAVLRRDPGGAGPQSLKSAEPLR